MKIQRLQLYIFIYIKYIQIPNPLLLRDLRLESNSKLTKVKYRDTLWDKLHSMEKT